MIDVQKMHCQADEVANWLKMLAHPERLMVLCQLTQGELPLKLLQQNSSLGQSALSQHLAILKAHQLVSFRKQSQQVFYSLADEKVQRLIEALQNICCADEKKTEMKK
ncbi:transcriptional regulator [Photobacterium gaetbulicola]|uniref:Transcriptional regulator n=1 Tax=Photobacterium gaetbulicola Gung47 TaxID=658445 RepID=A0A0C5WPS1_9GAMM|nr:MULTISPECIES: metalloregulator ArsR/SmtB family transcription factor [Photobacterium]AJR08322.1 transcriptional regulator [Photobacterium gaetbulicola Gung47]PSU09004.1 transcriptional regulator [Photobacterium gaetbulicola]WEM43554.1 metalloregulator ArsR/SmtB family transcription factor [Photobacterium sp. DA100]